MMVQIISTQFADGYLDYSELADGVSYSESEAKTPSTTRKSSSRPRASITNTKPELVRKVRTTRKGKQKTTHTPTKPPVTTPIVRAKNKRKSGTYTIRVESLSKE